MQKGISYVFILLTITAFIFSGCKRGEDDPFFTIHTRDARLTQPWKLVSMSGTSVNTLTYVQPGGILKDSVVNTEYTFDGTNIYITTDLETTSYNYVMLMDIKANGEVFSTETYANVATPGTVIATNSKTSFWYWGDDDKNKTAVYLDLTGILADYDVYDIPRLAWNDMTITISYSDNYSQSDTSGNPVTGSMNVNFELNFEVNLDLVN